MKRGIFLIFDPVLFWRRFHIREFLSAATLVFCSLAFPAKGQFMTSPDFEKLFPTGNTYKMSWWQLEGGGIYNVPTSGKQTRVMMERQDTTLRTTFTPGGGFSYSARLGRYHFTPDLRFFKYIDYSLGYRRIVGSESYESEVSVDGRGERSVEQGSAEFDEAYLMLNFHLNNVLQTADHGFLQNSIGVNAEYRLRSGKVGYANSSFDLEPDQPPKFFSQLNYRLGYGVKVSKKLYIVPALQTAILNVYPLDINSTLPLLNSRYRSISLSIKFLFLTRYHPSGY